MQVLFCSWKVCASEWVSEEWGKEGGERKSFGLSKAAKHVATTLSTQPTYMKIKNIKDIFYLIGLLISYFVELRQRCYHLTVYRANTYCIWPKKNHQHLKIIIERGVTKKHSLSDPLNPSSVNTPTTTCREIPFYFRAFEFRYLQLLIKWNPWNEVYDLIIGFLDSLVFHFMLESKVKLNLSYEKSHSLCISWKTWWKRLLSHAL